MGTGTNIANVLDRRRVLGIKNESQRQEREKIDSELTDRLIELCGANVAAFTSKLKSAS